MKMALFALAIVTTLLAGTCGGSKINLDDPDAIAKFNCEKFKDMMAMIEDPVANHDKISELAKEMEAFEKQFQKHHGSKAEEMEAKIEQSYKQVCPEMNQFMDER